MAIDDGAENEIDFRLRQKEREFQQALVAANGVRVEALADDGVVVPGQPVRVTVIVANHGDGGSDCQAGEVRRLREARRARRVHVDGGGCRRRSRRRRWRRCARAGRGADLEPAGAVRLDAARRR